MSLKEYARKRDFRKTPEPGPPAGPVAGAGASRFCVQRHDATRLHYDLRLEIGGTLKSWAIPKGPTLDPAQKVLAVHVEDHPLDYGEFEGNIPKGNYGAGSVMLWDRGVFELLGDAPAEQQLARGDLKLRFHGEKLRGEFALVLMKGRGKGNEWLLLKKKDATAVLGWDVEQHARSVKTGRTQEEIARDLPARISGPAKFDPAEFPAAVAAPMPEVIAPMMAQIADRPPVGDRWIYEVKWDGVRAVCFVDHGKLRIVSRTGTSFDRQYPELSVVPHYVSAEKAILDGEIAVLDANGKSSFSLIQPRIHVTDPNSVAHLARSTPVVLFVFDLLYLDGYDLRALPLIERKRILSNILKPCERMRFSDHFTARGDEMLAAATAAGLEGVLAKIADSPYEPRRSRNWLKLKVVAQQEFVICGYTHGERAHFSSLVLAVYEGGRLVWSGNVGTGFDERTLERIHALLEPLVTDRCPFDPLPEMLRAATWVRPELVCAVKFSEWTPDDKLRAPVFLGLRDDKSPRECVRERAEPPEELQAPVRSRARGPLLEGSAEQARVEVDGRKLAFTNLNKILYPREGYNKRDLINYYDSVADLIIPHLAGRPLSLKRYPDGIDKEFFFQKNTPDHAPAWLRIEPIHSSHRGEPIRYIVADDRATLLYLANLACIDQNPWMSRMGALEYPDFMLIDLDPQECGYDRIIEAAQLVRRKLDLLGLEGYPKTTGGDGMHVYVPLEPRYTYEQVRSFAELLSHLVLDEKPDLFTTPRSVAKRRTGKVYFDYLQISSSKTIAAPYVPRAYPGAPVATPLEWREVRPGLSPLEFNLKTAPARFERVGDLFAGVLRKPQALEPAIEKLAALMQAKKE